MRYVGERPTITKKSGCKKENHKNLHAENNLSTLEDYTSAVYVILAVGRVDRAIVQRSLGGRDRGDRRVAGPRDGDGREREGHAVAVGGRVALGGGTRGPRQDECEEEAEAEVEGDREV